VALFTGANAYGGGTTVSGGTLLINGSQPASQVTVTGGGILGGTGTVGIMGIGVGTIAPGGAGAGAAPVSGPGILHELRTVPARSRITVHVDAIVGLESTAPSVQVTSTEGLPLVVERSMFWDPTYYGGHTANAVAQPRQSWMFAEGSQGFFDTYVLVANANASPVSVNVTFLREQATPITRPYSMGPFSRLTVYAGDVPDVVNRSFGIIVEASLPVIAERAMYSRPRRGASGAAGT
jgi:hypothetical protein